MTCKKCGRPRQADGTETHWIGCPAALRQHARNLVEPDFSGVLCAFDGCHEPRKEWSGRGAQPKYCETHSNPKNRK